MRIEEVEVTGVVGSVLEAVWMEVGIPSQRSGSLVILEEEEEASAAAATALQMRWKLPVRD